MEPSVWGFRMRVSRATRPSCAGLIDNRLMAAILRHSTSHKPCTYPSGSKDPNNRVLGPKYYNTIGI